jgi:hypothetical protein
LSGHPCVKTNEELTWYPCEQACDHKENDNAFNRIAIAAIVRDQTEELSASLASESLVQAADQRHYK